VPGPAEVLVRLRPATLNYLDIAIATGNFPVPGFPMILVADGAGEVAVVGANVTAFKAGDRVIPHFMPRCKIAEVAQGWRLEGHIRRNEVDLGLPAVPSCRVAEHCWDPVGLAIVEYGYRFERLIGAAARGW
jgi:hypothetical protein